MVMWKKCTTQQFSHMLTSTHHSSILKMTTVMVTPGSVVAVKQTIFTSWTANLIQPDASSSSSKVSTARCWYCSWISQHPTDYTGISPTPTVITNCTPSSSVVHFNTTFIRGPPSNKTNTCSTRKFTEVLTLSHTYKVAAVTYIK